MRYDYSPYSAQNEQWEREEEAAAYKEMMAEEQGDQALELYNNLPEGTGAIFSPKMNELFGQIFDTDSDIDEQVNSLLYQLCLMQVQRQEAAVWNPVSTTTFLMRIITKVKELVSRSWT
ncbi:conserved hypothetical protein [Xenorhabdus bovienii str. puntauvense]|uniref:Uncharacterized protein n=1 Tax=Xenorhabdus bovienii str. puntauvense TaxID=1398201 RepID=A0A077NAZ9_XENBV|nr:hypothetical protein [Xenorhabdus bovienii]CDG95448.1 conserved hypothetical protein [Xenorhabdus bovienii str. puntauvense]